MFGVALLAGLGFTVSLLIGELAFGPDSARDDHVKIGVLVGSVAAALLATVVLRARNRVYRRSARTRSATTTQTESRTSTSPSPEIGPRSCRGGVVRWRSVSVGSDSPLGRWQFGVCSYTNAFLVLACLTVLAAALAPFATPAPTDPPPTHPSPRQHPQPARGARHG